MGQKPTYKELEQRIAELEAIHYGRDEMARIFEEFTNSSTEGLATADLGGKLTYVNPALGRILGGDPHELVGTDIRNYYLEEDLPNLEQNVLPSVETEVPQKVEMPLKSVRGEITEVIQSIFLIYDHKGKPYYANVITDITDRKRVEQELIRRREHLEELVAERTSDLREANEKLKLEITERRHAEEALQEREARLRFCLEGSGDGTWEWDLRTGRILFSARANAIFGIDQNKREFQRADLVGFVHPGHLEYLDKTMSDVREGTKQSYRAEFPIRSDEGSWRWMLSRGKVVTWTKDGKPERLFGTLSDITKRKQSEEALRDSEERFRILFENSRDAIFITSRDGVHLDVNQAALDLFGYSRDEVMSMNAKQRYANPDHRTRVRKELETRGYFQNYEVMYRKKAGTHMECVSTSTVRRDTHGNILEFQTIIRDMTEQKHMQGQLLHAQKMESVGTLAGGIAHDFNNLLMGIQGHASLMSLDIDQDHLHFDHLEGIEEMVKRGADLTRQLLGFARGGKYDVKPVDLNDLVFRSTQMFGRTRKDIRISCSYQQDIWSADADRGQIEQVLLNLFLNASEAMPRGGDLHLETENVSLTERYAESFNVESGNFVKITVADTGKGMDEETRRRVFEPFFTTKEMGRGTGLGLASAYGIIKNHGGIIDVSSTEGTGTVFTIHLPASGKGIEKEKQMHETAMGGSETVLLVDDEDMVLQVGERMLKSLGYKVVTAGSGEEAIRRYGEGRDKIDIVLLDMIMPGMGGGDAYDRIKEIDPTAKTLLSSGYSVDGQASEILERGCDGFIQKPFNMKQLSQKMREILDK